MNLSLHRCRVCGTHWLLWPDVMPGGGWNLLDKYSRPGACCDNVAMGEQIEHLRDLPLTVATQRPEDESIFVTHARRQGAADGFQRGWHAAFARMAEASDELKLLVPTCRAEEPTP
jgi:hypothetical protein